jgi:hypothetical protein
MLVKTAKKLCDNVLALLAKKPEHVEEQKTKENETIISQTDKTKSNNETTIVQNSESDSGYTRNYKSGDLIDPQFSKLKKKS